MRIGYLPQKQDWLDPDKTVLDQMLDASDLPVDEARNLLGRFLFTGDDVYKRTATSRAASVRGWRWHPDAARRQLLLLDEPTTHLDVASQEILQEVLVRFRGTILFVLARPLPDRRPGHACLGVEDGALVQFEGNYADYAASRREAA